MGMFDRPTPKIDLQTPYHIQKQQELMGLAGETADKYVAPLLKEKFGYESQERQLRSMAAQTDLSDGSAVQETYNAILAKNPTAAKAWIDSVMPILKQNIEQQKKKEQGGLSGTFADSLRTAAFIEGCDLKNPDPAAAAECRKKSYKTTREFKRGNPYAQASAKLLAEDAKNIYAEASDSLSEMAKYQQLEGLLEDIYTGWGSEGVVLPVMRLADTFGIDKKTAGKMEAFTSGAIEMALKYAQKTKGAISDREWSEFRTAAAGLERTEAGNRLLINTAMKYAAFRQKKAKELARWTQAERKKGEIPSMEAWNAHLYEWASLPANVISLPTDSEIEAARTAVASNVSDVQLDEGVDALINNIQEGNY